MSADPSFKGTRALVIDSNKAMLDGTVRQLVDLGVAQVLPCRDLAKARQVLEKLSFDFVLCADELEGCDLSGQTLLEELRRDSVLPHTTVFVLLANRATYLSVMEAAEAALDCLLLRPFRTSELNDRLVSARHRRSELAPVFDALNRGELPTAITECQRRMLQAGPYAQLCGRMAAELMLKTEQSSEALALFRGFAEADPPPAWARLGVARALMAQGDIGAARKELTSLLEADPQQPDAQDLLGRALVEQGELAGALEAYREALTFTPHCILRLQHGGTLAFYLGQAELALELLDRARSMDKQSRLFDAMTLMLLVLLHSDRGDARALGQVREALQQYQTRFPQSQRLRRMGLAADALLALAQDRPEAALAPAKTLAAEAGAQDFDLEAANMLLALWVRLPPRELSAGEQQQLVQTVALRFCVSRSAAAVLLASAQRNEVVSAMVRDAQTEIGTTAEAAMRLALKGEAGPAVHELLNRGESTGNARLIALAGQLLKRHGQHLGDAVALGARAAALQAQHCRPVTHIAGIRRTGRASGGLMVRMKPMAPTSDAAPLLADEAPTASEPGRTDDSPNQKPTEGAPINAPINAATVAA